MFKQLKLYYIIVSLPFFLLLTGIVAFFDAVRSTIIRNPHPQINYAIFCIILFGGIIILISVFRLMREAKTVVTYSKAVRNNADLPALQKLTDSFTGDVSYVLQMVTASAGRFISHQEQASIEHELANVKNRLYRRNALPQYLTGLLVGMGLLGTFVGLLATLNDISVLISSFSELDMTTANPLAVFRVMIERMKAPMQSMSIAFSASMFGLLGSIILGLMMVGIRRFQGDIASLLGSEVAKHIEIALSYEHDTPAVGGAIVTSVNAPLNSGEEYKVLIRIEERLAEAARLQQRILASEVEDFQKQRVDMLRVLTEQVDSSNAFRAELQQLARQFDTVLNILEKGNGDVCNQISDLTVNLAANAKESHMLLTMQIDEQKRLRESLDSYKVEEKLANSAMAVNLAANAEESHKLLAMQIDEQKRLRESLDSYKIEERLTEATRLQQRTLSSEIDDFQKQRTDMLRTLAEQNEANNNFRVELQQLGRQFGTISNSMEKGSGEIYNQITELMVHITADSKESQKLLTMQLNEQKGLRELLNVQKK